MVVGSLLGFVSEEKVEVRLRTPETSICFLLLGFACKVKRCAFPNFNHTPNAPAAIRVHYRNGVVL